MKKKNRTSLSKFLSYVLRHRPDAIGIELDSQGWVDVESLLQAAAVHGRIVTLQELEDVVQSNDKQRYAFSDDYRRIRANQGHSVEIELGYTSTLPPPFLYHGTTPAALIIIRQQGLLPMNRHHVHLSPDKRTAISVGQRRGKSLVLCVQAERMAGDGYMFYQTPNKVWLTEHVPMKYVSVV